MSLLQHTPRGCAVSIFGLRHISLLDSRGGLPTRARRFVGEIYVSSKDNQPDANNTLRLAMSRVRIKTQASFVRRRRIWISP